MDIAKLLIRFLFLAGVYFLPDFFIVSGLKRLFQKNQKKAKRIYITSSIGFFIFIIIAVSLSGSLPPQVITVINYIFGIFTGFVFFKLGAFIFLLLEDSIRLPLSYFKRKKTHENGKRKFISRRKFISQTAMVAGLVPFSGFIYGMFRGRYQFTIKKEILYFENLPQSFEGVTLTHFSDLHIGSWRTGEKDKLEYLVEIIQSLQSDILLYTGDIVNSKASEMNGWYDVFKKLSAPLGKFSVLGNHDYGDYVNWKSEDEKAKNLLQVKEIHPQIGFDLLLDENRMLEKEGEKLFIVGVENWGKGDFPKIGDVKKASDGIDNTAFKILLTHDPSHWDAKVLEEEYPPQLTLSGHTHGFQMGIETPAFRFSPSQWVYEQWAGLYEKKKTYLYVNRGIGTVGYPGRIGIWPEITQITLRKK
ncbi:MAG: metallophosphoesterase [Chitinophagales bacterium]